MASPSDSSQSYYLKDMKLGNGVDVITGKLASHIALDKSYRTQQDVFKGYTESFNYTNKVSGVQPAIGFTNSVTLPTGSTKWNFIHLPDSARTSGSISVSFLVFHWELKGAVKRISDARLSDNAQALWREDKAAFAKKYGHRYVSSLSYKAKFIAVWKCTSESLTNLKKFEKKVLGTLAAVGNSDFIKTLKDEAKSRKIAIEVDYQVVGDTGKHDYVKPDILRTFQSFRQVVKPVPCEVLLTNYKSLDASVDLKIPVELLHQLGQVFSLARSTRLLIDIAPGTEPFRSDRHERLKQLLGEIHERRKASSTPFVELRSSLQELEAMERMLKNRLERQHLIMELRAATPANLAHKYKKNHENSDGSWFGGKSEFILGRVKFSGDERKKYGVELAGNVSEIREEGVNLKHQVKRLEFPGKKGYHGRVVGIKIKSCNEKNNGYWCLSPHFKLGMGEVKIDVKSKESCGMHWQLDVYYIPRSAYEE